MRARLLQKFLITIREIDREASATVADPHIQKLAALLGDTPPVATPDNVGERQRIERGAVTFRAQFEPDGEFDFEAADSGLATGQAIKVTALRRDLVNAGLIDDDGNILVGQGTRLVSIKRTTGEVVWKVPEKPGLFATQVRRWGWGINVRRPRQDLVNIRFEERDAVPGRVSA